MRLLFVDSPFTLTLSRSHKPLYCKHLSLYCIASCWPSKTKVSKQKYFLNLILLAVDRSTINKRFAEKWVCAVIFFTPEKIKINKKTELLLLGIEILNLKTFFDFWSTEVYNYNFLPLIYWFILGKSYRCLCSEEGQ